MDKDLEMQIDTTPKKSTFSDDTFNKLMQEKDGVQFRSAREIAPLFGYASRRHFKTLVEKAKENIKSLGEQVEREIVGIDKVVNFASGGEWLVPEYDFLLTRYACYLVAQNGDPRKKEIALCKQYFAIQTRTAERHQEYEKDKLRLQTREEIKEQNRKLNETAAEHGVKNFGTFTDAGYLGLYGMRSREIRQHKDLGDDALLDRADITELAANLFRITQTNDKIKNSSASSQDESDKIHFMVGGKVRQTIKDIGGILPEELPLSDEHIKDVAKRVKKEEKILGANPTKKKSGVNKKNLTSPE